MIVLASASKARKRMLEQAGIDCIVQPSQIDEQALKAELTGIFADDIALHLASAKALDVSKRRPGQWVLGADQTLICSGQSFDKPANLEQAKEQLSALKGHWHRLISAAVLARDGVKIWHGSSAARLHMRPFSDSFLSSYLAKEQDFVLQSVGAYRIEGLGAQLFDKIEGDNFTIQGLPMLALLEKLRDLGEIAA